MGYRDEVINRLKQTGGWERMAREEQENVLGLNEDEARALMVKDDEFERAEQSAVIEIALASMDRTLNSFAGNLIERKAGYSRLSDAGILLADFVATLRAKGLSDYAIEDGFRQLDSFSITSLMTIPRSRQGP